MHSLEYMFSSHAWQPTPERPSSGQPAPSGVVCGAVVVGVVLKLVVGAGVVLEVLVVEGVVLEVVGAGLVVVPDKVVSATVVVVLQDVVCAGFVVAVVRVSVVVVGDGVARELFADVIIGDGVVSVKLDEVCGAVELEVAGVVVLLIDDVGAGLVGGGVVTKVSMLQSAQVQPSSQMQVPSHPRHRPWPLQLISASQVSSHPPE
jgi:hypothetical protein